MTKKNSVSKSRLHRSSIHWYNMDHWLLNGFLLPDRAHSALCELITLGRFPSLDTAIREGVRIVLEENMSMLVRSDHKWIRLLSPMDKVFKDPAMAKPDEVGAENLRFLSEMYKAMAKAEKAP